MMRATVPCLGVILGRFKFAAPNKIQNGLFNEALIGFQLRGCPAPQLMSETN